MKTLNIIRRIVSFPFAVVLFPVIAIMGFLMTNWEDERDREYYKSTLKNLFK